MAQSDPRSLLQSWLLSQRSPQSSSLNIAMVFQLVLSMIVQAVKRQSCILNEDVQTALFCGGKERHHWATRGDVSYV